MADNIELSAGSGGAVLSTDEVTRSTVVQHVQYVKLMNGTDAAVDVIPGEATNGLDVDVTRSALPTGAATSANQSTANTALAAIQAAVEGQLTVGVAGGSVGLLAGAANIGNVAVSSIAAGDNNIGNVDVVSLPALAAGTNNIGDVDVLSIAAGDNNIGNVDIVTMPNVTLAAGTNTNEMVGDAAHDAAIAGNPVRIGLRAMSADYTAVATGDTADALASLTGKQIVLPYTVPAASWSYASPAAVADTADDEAKAAGAAGVRHYITGVQVFNGHDTVGTEVVIKDGSTVLWRGWAEQTGGGCSARFDPPLRGTAATAVNVANITTGSATYFNLQGYDASE